MYACCHVISCLQPAAKVSQAEKYLGSVEQQLGAAQAALAPTLKALAKQQKRVSLLAECAALRAKNASQAKPLSQSGQQARCRCLQTLYRAHLQIAKYKGERFYLGKVFTTKHHRAVKLCE